MSKCCDNAFCTAKINFAIAVVNLIRKKGVVSHNVMAVFCEERNLTLSSVYPKVSSVLFVSCISKDLRFRYEGSWWK